MTAVMERPEGDDEEGPSSDPEGKVGLPPEVPVDYSAHGPTACTVLFDADRRKGRQACGTVKVPVGDPDAPFWVCPKCDQLVGQSYF